LEQGTNRPNGLKFDKSEKQQAFHAQMMADCQAVLKANGVNPIVGGSALLGWRREKDLIPWEGGVVLCVRMHEIKNAQQEKKIYDELIEKGFEITKYFNKKEKWKITAHKKPFNVEIVGFFKNKKNYVRIPNRKRIRTIPKHFLTKPFSEIEIRGVKYRAPLLIDEFLSHLYVNWQIVDRHGLCSEFRNKNYSKLVNEK